MQIRSWSYDDSKSMETETYREMKSTFFFFFRSRNELFYSLANLEISYRLTDQWDVLTSFLE